MEKVLVIAGPTGVGKQVLVWSWQKPVMERLSAEIPCRFIKK